MSRQVIKLPLDGVCPDPCQPRKQIEELKGLASSMKQQGQLHPLLVYERDGKRVILDGERRWRAAHLAGLAAIDIIEVDAAEGEILLEQALVANWQREELTPLERARGIDRLMRAAKINAATVSQRLGVAAGTVSKLLSLLKLPDTVQAMLERGELSAATAYQLSLIGDSAAVKQMANEAAAGGLSRDVIAGRVKRAARKGTTRKPAARCVAKLSGARSIAVSGPGLSSLDALISCLEELLAKARKARPKGLELPTFLALLRDEARADNGGQA